MTITHLTTTLGGGAGGALLRSHRALLVAGLDSRVLAAQAPAADVPRVALCPRRPASLLERAARRAGVLLDASDRMLRSVEKLRSKIAPGARYELFSPPFARFSPEQHPWLSEPGVVHLNWIAGFVDWPRFFARQARPLVITLHDQNNHLGGLHYHDDVAANPWLAPIENAALELKRRAIAGHRVAVVGNSEWSTREAEASGFFPADTSFDTVLYALDTSVFSPLDRNVAKARLGLSPDRRVIGFACDDLSNRRKGFSVLAQALRTLAPEDARDTSLVSFGRSPDRSLSDTITLPWQHLGFIDNDSDKAAAYSAMDVFVVPSLAEAFGQTAIEAMACGATVIASRVGGLSEALDHGRAGLLVPAGQPDELRDALAHCLRSPEHRATLAAAGRACVVDKHSPARHAAAYRSIFDRLLPERESRPQP